MTLTRRTESVAAAGIVTQSLMLHSPSSLPLRLSPWFPPPAQICPISTYRNP